jgi:hypothetical protein
MRQYSINDIKQELSYKSSKELMSLVLKLAKYKKENKELAAYLLFQSDDVDHYIEQVKLYIKGEFDELLFDNNYKATKQVRKIIRIANKYIKYSGSDKVQVEVLLLVHDLIQPIAKKKQSYTPYTTILENQKNKIVKSISKLHEDLQHDYLKLIQNWG